MGKKEGVNGKAIVSIVLGGLSFVTPFFGILLAIMGIFASRIAKKEIVETNMNIRGIEFAAFGFIICILGGVNQIYKTFIFFTA